MIEKSKGPNLINTWHKAGWVVQDPQTVIRDGLIQVSNSRITAITSSKLGGPDPVHDHGPGVIIPALVNAHTHLELSALKGKLSRHLDFEAWVRQLIKIRAGLSKNDLLGGIDTGIKELIQTGCGIAAEVATLGMSKHLFRTSKLEGIWFREYIGNASPDLQPVINSDSHSLAGHAPHTTSPDLLIQLKRLTRQHQTIFTIHLSESNQEIEFIETGQGAWAELLKERHIDFSSWPLPAKSPVAYLDRLNLLDDSTLAVHLLKINRDDLDTLADRGVSVVVCPRSNRRLHGEYPEIDKMLAGRLNVCVGTDSLASSDTLSIFDEMAIIANRYPRLSPGQVLAMATTNGARALGLESQYGRLAPGYRFAALYLPVVADKSTHVLEKIIHGEWDGHLKWAQSTDH